MMSIEKKIEYLELLENLSEAFGETDDQTDDDIRNEFIEEDFDISTATDKVIAFQKEISMADRRRALDEAKIAREMSQPATQRIFEYIGSLTLKQVVERIEQLMSLYPGNVAISHRDLETKKEEDLRSLLEDLERARLMSEGDD